MSYNNKMANIFSTWNLDFIKKLVFNLLIVLFILAFTRFLWYYVFGLVSHQDFLKNNLTVPSFYNIESGLLVGDSQSLQ